MKRIPGMFSIDAAGGGGSGDARPDFRPMVQCELMADMGLRLCLWSCALVLTSLLFSWMEWWPARPLKGTSLIHLCKWAACLSFWIIFFNIFYVVELILLRRLVPTPAAGEYRLAPGGKLARPLIWTWLTGLLHRARLEALFPACFVHHIASLPPFRWLMDAVQGYKSNTIPLIDGMVLDPHLVTMGRNVIIGLEAIISPHYYAKGIFTLKPIIIEDNVLVGGRAMILGGCHLKTGCMIGINAIVLPDTVVGENEFWGGVPARKIGDLTRSTP